jgi:hypothetical protein
MRHPHSIEMQRTIGIKIRQFLSSVAFCLGIAAMLLPPPGAYAQDTAPPPPADAQQQPAPESNDVRAVRLSDVEGKVQVFNGSTQAFDQAQMNMPVVEGMRLVTASDGRVEVQFEDGSVARVTPNSSITLARLQRGPDGSTITEVDANAGLSYYELNGRAGQYSVKFGSNTITPSDNSIFRVNLDQNPEIAVTHGTVRVAIGQNPDSQNAGLEVHTNQSLRFDGQDPSQYDLAQSVTADSWDQWNSDRDQVLASMDDSATTARASSGNPDDPAWNDLDYYGDWYNVPGYGMGWAPSGTDSDWDPFGNGAWGYYSGIGYAWISPYSWGWWPYHCGAWNWFNQSGWLWFPGNCGWGSVGSGWYPYATVWRVPPGYKLPLRPSSPGHGLPPHGPITHPQPLVAVNRNPQSAQQFRSVGQPKPQARSFQYEGQVIHPETPSIHAREGGPLGESFTSSAQRTNPDLLDQSGMVFGSVGVNRGVGNNVRGAYQPGNHGYVPAPSNSGSRPAWNGAPNSGYRGGFSGGAAPPAPHYSAPPPPPPSPAGGRPH